MPSIRLIKPFIPSGADFTRAKHFFQDLGFTAVWEAEGYAELRLGAAAFILQHFENHEMQSNLMLFAAVDDVDAWWQHVLFSGVIEKYGVRAAPPTLYPWGQREVHLIDTAGVCWHFG